MKRETRISAGGIILRDGKVLLVRYNDNHGGSYLVGPGGGVQTESEAIPDALVREVMEETAVKVVPIKLLFAEDLLSRRYRMIKFWFFCEYLEGEAQLTRGAIGEGITEVGWYRKADLKGETVYPPVLTRYGWKSFSTAGFEARYLDLRTADF